jgi:endoglucanase
MMREMLRSNLQWAALGLTLACSPAKPPSTATHASGGEVPISSIRVDQYGYTPAAKKLAIWVNPTDAAVPWELIDVSSRVVARGITRPFGEDGESGDVLSDLDFSTFQAPGAGYTLRIAGQSSHPFEISADLYSALFKDAARYFYLNRSGAPLEMPFVGDPSRARPAGHVSDVEVPCLPGSGCDYTLDVRGGWYDAGDYGKYVVNGGLSAWLLLDAFELAAVRGRASWFADGHLDIPEGGNGVPDVLDEARVEIEFMLAMQVPEEQSLAGMVHHKVHDTNWSALGKPPTPRTKLPRFLHPPSTAATLNLAAVGALAARLYQNHDPVFAQKCLGAARRAFDAAQKNSDRFAPDGMRPGGGPYADDQLADEFYWSAAELFVTTHEPVYAHFARSSPFFQTFSASVSGLASSFNWSTTDVLGSISLLLHADLLEPREAARIHQQLEQRADAYLALIQRQGYRFPLGAGRDGTYPWGSNSFVTNNAIILALAHQFTQRPAYREGVYEAVHYILGRNANDFSYVSGYGTRGLSHPHHRFWAQGIDPRLPAPPPGALAGGPNSHLQDTPMKLNRAGCKPQKCYLDDLGAYSVNEVAINWNASLAWVAAYLAMQQ